MKPMAFRRVLPFLLFGLLAPSVLAQDIAADAKKEVLDGIKKVLDERAFVPGKDLSKWEEFIAKHKEALDKTTTIDEFGRETNRALREFGFSHIRLRSPRAAEARGRTFVVGPGFNAKFENSTLVVTAVTPKSPAETAGIKPGDVIVEVDGKTPENANVIDGEEGKEISLKVKQEAGEPKEVKITRARISTVRPETLTWAGDDAAVLRIYTFSAGYNRKNVEDLIKQANEKGKYLVLDLRSNGGGAVNNLQHLLSLLLPPDTVIGSFIGKSLAKRYADETKGDPADVVAIAKWSDRKYKTTKRDVEPFKGKIAVLINRASASASEICAAALKENAKAPLVGARSAGAVLASVYAKLPQGFELQYPVSDFVTANGVRLEANPLAVDAEETGRPVDGKDPAVEKALELLRKG